MTMTMTKTKAKAKTAPGAKSDWRAELNNELSEALRKRIVEATRRCLKKSGKLRMEEVAKEAGCSRGTLYRYVTSKEEILLAIATADYLRIAATVADEIQRIKDPRIRFATGLARSMALVVNDDTLSLDIVNRTIAANFKAMNAVIASSLAPYVEAVEEQGLLRSGTNLEEAALWIVQSSNGLLNTGWPNVGGKTLSPKQQVDYLCRYLLFPVLDMEGY